MEDFKKGIHILSTLELKETHWHTDCDAWLASIRSLIIEHGLHEVGSTHYIFPNLSYTAAICLMESHICIHTWPEHNKVYLDIYVCNLHTDNTDKAIQVYNNIVSILQATIIQESKLER